MQKKTKDEEFVTNVCLNSWADYEIIVFQRFLSRVSLWIALAQLFSSRSP
jgi:hypothetical protein